MGGEVRFQEKQSEYQPWGEELKKIIDLSNLASEIYIHIISGNNSAIENYFSVINELYSICLRPLMYKDVKKQWDKRMKEIERLYAGYQVDLENGYDSPPPELLTKLRRFHVDLIDFKQNGLRLGIPMYEGKSAKSKIRTGIISG